MAFISTDRGDRDPRAVRAIAAEAHWVRFLVEIVFPHQLDPPSRRHRLGRLEEAIQLLLRRKALLPAGSPLMPDEARLALDPGWMLSVPVLELRFPAPVAMEMAAREELARQLEAGLNAAIKDGRVLPGEEGAKPLLAWVRPHPDQRCWPSPSLI